MNHPENAYHFPQLQVPAFCLQATFPQCLVCFVFPLAEQMVQALKRSNALLAALLKDLSHTALRGKWNEADRCILGKTHKGLLSHVHIKMGSFLKYARKSYHFPVG